MDRYFTELRSWHCKSKVLLENTQRRKQDRWRGMLPYGVSLALPKQACASTPGPLFSSCPAAKNVPANPLSAPPCVSTHPPPPHLPAAGLSPLCQVSGTSVAGNPAGEMKEAWTGYETAGGRVQLPGPELWRVASLLSAWHLQTVTSPVTCHPMRPPRKLGKPDVLLTTPASQKKAPETYDKELPWLRPNAFVLGNLRRWLPGWHSLMKGKRKGEQTKGKADGAGVSSQLSYLSLRFLWEEKTLAGGPWTLGAAWALTILCIIPGRGSLRAAFPDLPGLPPLTTTRASGSTDISTSGASEHFPGVPACWVFVALSTQIAVSCWQITNWNLGAREGWELPSLGEQICRFENLCHQQKTF